MIQPDELILFLIGTGVMIFILVNRPRLHAEPGVELLMAAFISLLVGWFLTIAEGFILKDTLNFLEHTCYSLSSLLLAIWCFKMFLQKEKKS